VLQQVPTGLVDGGDPRGAHFRQNTASVSVFWFAPQSAGRRVNATAIFWGEHCVCSCVHPLRRFLPLLRYVWVN
jgi:hypothetical protein